MSLRTSFVLNMTLLAGAAIAAAGCGSSATANHTPDLRTAQGARRAVPGSSQIQHVVVIVQENRTVDDLFNGFPGADTTLVGYDSHGNPHVLRSVSLGAPCDPGHSHASFVTEFANGSVNGWTSEGTGCPAGSSLPDGVFAYVPQNETTVYWSLAANYGFADEVFQANEGPSYPAHQYLIAAQSGGHGSDAPWAIAENGKGNSSDLDLQRGNEDGSGGSYCGAPAKDTVVQINLSSPFPGVEGNRTYPCKDYQTIFDLATNAGLTWKYYSHTVGGFWSGPDSVLHLWQNPATRATLPETQVLTDIQNHQLANVVFVTPSSANSDHPHVNGGNASSGPNWVASIVNAIGNDSTYWNNTTILITWDDWGGWFDHAVPSHPFSNDPYEYGFRVPLVVVSPYAIAHTVDHTQRSVDSILAYIETTFGLGSLGMLDAQTDDLSSMFNYSQSPLQYVAP